ncbi:transmembrane protein 256 homolog [Porites lutea]|uniref:transmembrane protein 256 homolog n=1 Tax=Porites lutea TaxID=51062 RepID=UPI003CC61F2C
MAAISPSLFHKIASVSGALAIALGAYGAHASSMNQESAKKFKESFMTGNLYHHLHNLALLAVPFAKRPILYGSLMCAGILLFSGSCYIVGITRDKSFGKLAPVGGYLLMAGWLTFAF